MTVGANAPSPGEAAAGSTDAGAADEVWILSGATGALGGRLLQRLRERGARIGVPVRKAWQVQRLQEQHPDPRVLVAHVDDAEAAAGFVKGVEDSLGPVTSYVSAAGAYEGAPIGREPNDAARRLLDANFLSIATLVRAVVTPMKRRRTGSLVFTGAAAAAADPPPPGMSLYIASKACLHAYARSLAVELAADGLRIAVVLPQTIDTPANRAAMPHADTSRWQPLDAVVDTLLAAAAGTLPGPGPLFPVIRQQ